MGQAFQWKDKTYQLGSITTGVKRSYCDWFRRHLAVEISNGMPIGDAQANALLKLFAKPPFWNDGTIHELVNDSFGSEAGSVHLHRLLLGTDANVLADADILAMVLDKQGTPGNDYDIAWRIIREEMDPNRNGSGAGGERPGVTNTSAAS